MTQQSHCWAYTEKTRIERETCTPMFIAALFIIVRTWKQPRCPSADEWIRKLLYIYTMEYYSAIKKNTFESVLMRWMKLELCFKWILLNFLQSPLPPGNSHCPAFLHGILPIYTWTPLKFPLSCSQNSSPLLTSCFFMHSKQFNCPFISWPSSSISYS